MISSINPSISGLASVAEKMASTANNIANSNTEGFKKTTVNFEEQAPQGVKATAQKVDEPGPVVMEQKTEGVVPVEMSNVDLATEMTDLTTGQQAYEANLKSLQTAAEMQESIVDIKE